MHVKYLGRGGRGDQSLTYVAVDVVLAISLMSVPRSTNFKDAFNILGGGGVCKAFAKA